MPRVLIVDVSYLMFRSYFGYPNLTARIETKNGLETLPIGAFFGFTKTILTIIKNYQIDELILATDLPFPTWRHEAHDNYKSGRKEMDESLRIQTPIINNWCRQITKNFLSLKGLEADDLIASSVINLNLKMEKNLENLENSNLEKTNEKIELKEIDKMANFLDFRSQYSWTKTQNYLENIDLITQNENNKNSIKNSVKEIKETMTKPNFLQNCPTSTSNSIQINQDSQIFIYSKDRDLFQLLVFDNVFFVENESKFEVFGKTEFEKKYELLPNQWLCWKTLVGDSSDKLDGIAGIGPKTATQILQKYQSVANFVHSKIDDEKEQKNEKNLAKKLSKWQDKIDLEKIAKIRRLSSLCWIDLELQSGFDLQNGLENLARYKFGSLIGTQNQIYKQNNQTLDNQILGQNFDQESSQKPNSLENIKNIKKIDKNSQNQKTSQNRQIEMEDLF